ncbi:N-acetylmuramoyl-L-alanine amidase family protein [Virgibacillus pantothenticus]|uniref:N-acetylmuramoyl-L-alanine amidase family protein n=3 Tax=Virgibacillus pantothenticus TaxID=1473 RepID=UPI00095401AB|nr:N-acetylmuramoyl-L-alanine amidase [Virgibacillus pantothenticus]QTY14792.1 N-acetylmuramoyl-L-alanine amidase [Virgibacillus pantothenticus]SIT17569.1 N-acetylmuramoyl-L-alanine amidase [Virgibacillus pantothenticus]
MAKVAIGAGHGYHTPGKRTPDGEREWSFNNKVVTAAVMHLKEYGIDVLRLDDPSGKTDVPLSTRTNKANEWDADILISYHHNANIGKWGNWTGTETYYYPGASTGLALAKAIHPSIVGVMGLRDRGIKTANLHMVRESKMPAILIEGGFMDSTIDIKVMRNDEVLERAGKALADAIADYFGVQAKPSKPSKPAPEPKPSKKYKSVVDYMKDHKMDASFNNRKRLAEKYGIKNYRGTASQNVTLLNKLQGRFVKSTASSKPKPKSFKVGQKVTVKKSASKFATGESIASFVKGNSYKIIQVKSDRVLLDGIMSWVRKKDVY